MILVVEERRVGRDGTAPGGLHRRTKQRYVQYVLFPRDWLTVQSLPNLRGQNRLGVCVREKVGVVVAGEADDMGYYTKDVIGIDKEWVCFPACLSD